MPRARIDGYVTCPTTSDSIEDIQLKPDRKIRILAKEESKFK